MVTSVVIAMSHFANSPFNSELRQFAIASVSHSIDVCWWLILICFGSQVASISPRTDKQHGDRTSIGGTPKGTRFQTACIISRPAAVAWVPRQRMASLVITRACCAVSSAPLQDSRFSKELALAKNLFHGKIQSRAAPHTTW